MPGLTLSAEEIRGAPPEVRRWLEVEIGRALGIAAVQPQPRAQPLVGCNVEEARDILDMVQGMLPVVSVFFELGREAASVPVHGMRAFRIADIVRHARLATGEQVLNCLGVLDQALQRVRGDGNAAFHALDEQGHCLIAESTMQAIMHLWQEIVARHGQEPVAAV